MKGLMTPVAPPSVLFLIQAGYAADFILLMTVESINGFNNRSAAPARMNPGDPEFFQVVEHTRRLEAAAGESRDAPLYFRESHDAHPDHHGHPLRLVVLVRQSNRLEGVVEHRR